MRLLVPLLCFVRWSTAEDIDPKIYAKLFMNNKPLFDRMSEIVKKDHVQAGAQVLDLGSGPGEPTVTLATMAPNIHIVCTDFQAAMNEKAQARVKAAGLINVDFALTSADDLSAWKDSEFDAVMMSLVLMFVPDKARSLKEVARVLKPGGLAYTAVWKELPFYDLAHSAMQVPLEEGGPMVAGKSPPPFPINPLALAAGGAVEELAVAAGLELIALENLTYDFKLGTPHEAADAMLILAGGVLTQMEADGDAGATERFRDTVVKMIEHNGKGWNRGGDVVISGNTVQILTVRKEVKSEL